MRNYQNIEIIKGLFVERMKIVKIAEEEQELLKKYGLKKTVIKVRSIEEKGSDVNLATHLLNDAWKDEYDVAVIYSNDSDLKEAMRLVKENSSNKKKIVLVSPLVTEGRRLSKVLTDQSDLTIKLTKRQTIEMERSQMPDEIPLPSGRIVKNPWRSR